MQELTYRLPRVTRAMLRAYPGWFFYHSTRPHLAAMTGIGKR